MEEKNLEIEKEKKGRVEVFFPQNAPFFRGHFPGYPVVPGVLLLKAAQNLGAKTLGIEPEKTEPREISNTRFRRQVRPGEKIIISVFVTGPFRVIGEGYLEGELVFSTEMVLCEGGQDGN